MDTSVADKLTMLAGKTQAFSRLEPEHIQVREISAPQMAAVLTLVCDRPDVDVAGLARGLAPKCTRMRWNIVFEALDSPDALVLSPEGTNALLLLLYKIAPDAVHHFLAHKWQVLNLQTDLVAASTQANLAAYGVERVVEEGPLANHPLNFRPLITLVLDAVCREPPNEIVAKTFLDTHVKFVPELFLIGGMYMPEPWPRILERILVNLFAIYFSEIQEVEISALAQIRALNPSFLYNACVDLYTRDTAQLDRIVVTAHALGLIDAWLETPQKSNYPFTLEVIAAVDRLGLGSAKEMLVSKFVTLGPDAIIALFYFIELKIAALQGQHQDHNILTLRTVAAFETLTASIDVPPDHVEQLRALQIQCLQAYPRLINFGQGHDEAILANNDLPTFPPDVETEMKMWFQKMYEQQIEIRDIIAMLEQLKDSDVPREQDLFACMTHSLFDEYRFFPEYPVNALATTAVLFGSLIHFKLIDNIPLSVALRFILESLRQPVESNMFRFGLQALFELRQRLPEFPKYCSVLLNIPGLVSQQQFYQQIKDIVYASSSIPQVENNAYKSLSADMDIVNDSFEKPSEVVKDKILFVVNNLSPANVKSKSKELIALLDQRFHGWFASYIVGERAIQEPNYHTLYIQMLSAINSQNLVTHCCQVLYLHVISTVNNPDVLSLEKRTELKNLGAFLGNLLLGNNRPILHNNINFKLLLAEASQLERLPAIIPFVCKILDKAVHSRIFAPPNTWLMGILAVLSEVYVYGNLKLNLKFEIEVLCNELGLKIETIEPSNFVRNQELISVEQNMAALQVEPSTSAGNMAGGMPIGQEFASAPPPGNPLAFPVPGLVPGAVSSPAIATAGLAAGAAPTGVATQPAIPALAGQFQLVGTTEFVTHPTLRQIFEMAINKTIQEVLLPVVKRSASIAAFSAKELITKDFALEPDENKMRMAAHSLVSVLAMSMSLVSAKDPFVESLAADLRALMVSNGYGEHASLMDQVPIAARDNADVIIPLVESAAREKAIADVDEALLPSYILRQRFHQQAGQNDTSFVDQLQTSYPLHLPDPLALKAGGLTPQQLAIYDEFSLTNEQSIFGGEVAPGVPGSVGVAEPHAALENTVRQMQTGVDTLVKLTKDTPENSFADLTPDNAILNLINQIVDVATKSTGRDEIILKTSQIVVSAMFTADGSDLACEAMCYLLVKLCSLSAVTAKEVVLWLIYSDDERKYNVQVMGTLIRAKLITATELDVNLGKEIAENNEATLNFAAGLILDSVLGANPYCLRAEFTASLEAMEDLAKQDTPSAVAKDVLQALKEARGDPWSPGSNGGKQLRENMGLIFAEWTRLAQRPSSSPRALHVFIYELSEQKILSNQEPLFMLIRTATESSIESYSQCLAMDLGISEVFVGIDSLAKLIVTILQTTVKMSTQDRLRYAESILSLIFLLLANDHEKEQDLFNGQPYFRFFSTLLFEISTAREEGTTFWTDLLLSVGNIFEQAQPLALPAFASSWIALISHRHFMNKLFNLPKKQGWPLMFRLLECLFDFLVVYVNDKQQSESTVLTYQGSVWILTVISHDFPAFFIEYSYGLCNAVPVSFTQARNIILSATTTPLPNSVASSSQGSIDFSSHPAVAPIFDISGDLARLGALKPLEAALRTRSPVIAPIASALSLREPKKDAGVDFESINVSVAGYNALTYYIGSTLQSPQFEPEGPQAIVCLRLLQHINPEARYFFVSSMVNHLRYNNVYTHFYSDFILHLFTSQVSSDILQVVVRVLLERVICNRPHPWGLMSTFSQLLKNPQCMFWELPFIRVAPEIQQMLRSLYAHINSLP